MKFGIAATTSVTPATTAMSQAEYVKRVAEAAEAAGYDSVWASDRTMYPADLATRYPTMFEPGHANPDAQNVLEVLTTLSYVAGMTEKVRLGISVLVLPFRNPLLNAKMITTLDVMSGGRAIFGVGLGWMPEEFASNKAVLEDRGAVTDEHIEVFKVACMNDVPEYHGKHVQTSGMVFFPRPVQQPHPPVWIGGNSQYAIRRAARLGDAWHGIRLTPSQIAEMRESLRVECERHDREPSEVQVTLRATLELGDAKQDSSGQRVPLTGRTQQILDDVRRYEDAGLDYLVLSVAAPSTDATVDTVARFGELVL